MTDAILDPTATFLDMADDGTVVRFTNTPDFWDRLARGDIKLKGRLLTTSDVKSDMTGWEMHPAGDEVIVAVSAAVDLVFDLPAGPERVAVPSGHVAIVPKGVWHRFEVREPGRLMFITAGEGTEHRQ